MLSQQSHLTDQELLLAADGELGSKRAAEISDHLSECWLCRARKQALDEAIVDFIRLHRGHFDPLLPSAAGPRAKLRARLAEVAGTQQSRPKLGPQLFGWRQAAAGLFLAAILVAGYHYWLSSSSPRIVLPEARLTPGAVATVNREQVCNSDWPKNRGVPATIQHKVFEEYGIPNAAPRAYEVDYLITPALGGSDDIRNLWPQTYSNTAWNAYVKDALEDRLRGLVCSGQLDLATAQHDISTNWIAAYQKYFHTDKPRERWKTE
jgi:hypothetical protein